MKKRNGFTLVELLAVIIILAVVLLIAIPAVLNIIETSKKNAFKDSVLSMINETDKTMALSYITDEGITYPSDGETVYINVQDLNVSNISKYSGQIGVTNNSGNLEYIAYVTDGTYRICSSVIEVENIEKDPDISTCENIVTVKSTPEERFVFNSSTGTITGYNGITETCPSDVVIPSIINGEAVTTIEDEAFFDNQLTSVTIGNSVTTIGFWAFSNNQLTSVTIGNNVTTIESGAFLNNQLTSITIPNNVTTIGVDAFRFNYITQGNAKIDNSNGNVTIGNYVFDNNGSNQDETITPTYLR